MVLDVLGGLEYMDNPQERIRQMIDKEADMANMDFESVYVLQKGEERVSMADNKSLIDLANALFVLDCTENISKKQIKGNKQALDVYMVSFLDKNIKVIGMADVEKVTHWMLSFGCKKVCIKMFSEEGEEEK